MNIRVGEKRTVIITDPRTGESRKWPGIIWGEVQQLSHTTLDGRDTTIERANVLSLRSTNPANGEVRQYLTETNEALRFTPVRYGSVVGLDVDENGETISLAKLSDMHADSIADFSRRNAAAAAPVSIDALDA
jgi:hypothetical protein